MRVLKCLGVLLAVALLAACGQGLAPSSDGVQLSRTEVAATSASCALSADSGGQRLAGAVEVVADTELMLPVSCTKAATLVEGVISTREAGVLGLVPFMPTSENMQKWVWIGSIPPELSGTTVLVHVFADGVHGGVVELVVR